MENSNFSLWGETGTSPRVRRTTHVTPTRPGNKWQRLWLSHRPTASQGDPSPRGPQHPYRMLSRSATILSRSWNAQSRRHLATSASWRASFSSWHRALHCFRRISASLLALPASIVTVSLICKGTTSEQRGRLLGLLVQKCPPTGAGAGWREVLGSQPEPIPTPPKPWRHAPQPCSHQQWCYISIHPNTLSPSQHQDWKPGPSSGLRGPGEMTPRRLLLNPTCHLRDVCLAESPLHLSRVLGTKCDTRPHCSEGCSTSHDASPPAVSTTQPLYSGIRSYC